MVFSRLKAKNRKSVDLRPVERIIDKQLERICCNLVGEEQISEKDIKRIIDLKSISDIFKQKRIKRRPWLIPVLFILVLIAISALLFIHVGDTKIDADLLSSGLSFSPLAKAQIISFPIAMKSATLAGLQRIYFPPQGTQVPMDLNPSLLHIRSASTPSNTSANVIVLDKVVVAKDDTLELLREGDLWSIKIYNQDGEPIKSEISLILRGEIAVEHAGITSKISYGEPAWPRILVHPSGFKLSFSVGKAKNQIILQQLPIDYLSFTKKVNLSDTPAPLFSWRSSILSGNIYFEELKGQNYSLRRGENLGLGIVSGTLRLLKTETEYFRVMLHGTVDGLSVGNDPIATLMPTWLKWFKAQEAPALLWFSSLYVFGLIYTILKWWKGL